MELIVGTFLLKEIFHYNFYKKLLTFVEKKTYHNIESDSEWYENYILNELSADELKINIRNVFSYNNNKITDVYYIPIELNDIPRNKMFKWVSYSIYHKSLWQLSQEQLNQVSIVLDKIEKKVNITFEDKLNQNVYFLKFGNNRVECDYRPAIICSCLDLLKDACYASLYLKNFNKYKVENTDIVYFYYHHKDHKKTVFFLHGIGLGIEPYLYYILRLRTKFNLIVLVLPNLSNMEYRRSMRIISHEKIFPSYETWRNVIKHIIIKHNMNKINFIAHSFGTIMLGLLLKNEFIQSRTERKVFIEPVCFIDRAYKTYRYINDPQNNDYGIIGILFNAFIYKDIYLKYITQRFLYGPEFWVHDYDSLSHDSLVIVSEKDQIVPSDEVYERMKKHNIQCMYIKGAYHADMFMSSKYDDAFDKIDEWLSI